MALGLKGPTLAKQVPSWMGRVDVRAWNPAGRQRFVRRVRAAMRQQFRKHMGVRPARALAVGWRDRLINLDAAEAADKDAMRIGRQDYFHDATAGTKYRFSCAAPQRRDDVGIPTADIKVSLQSPEAEIEQDAGAIFLSQGLAVEAGFSQLGPSASRAACFRQAECDPMAPASGGEGLGRDRAEFRMPRDTQRAARRDRRHGPLVPIKHDRFVGVAHEFGEGPERAEAPCDLAVGDLVGKEIQEIGHYITLWLRRIALGGTGAEAGGAAGGAALDGEPPAVSLMPA